MPEPEPIGEYLRRVRRIAGLTLRDVELRTASQVKNGYLSQVETGHIQRPSPSTLWQLAQVYGVDYNDLLVRSGHRAEGGERATDLVEGVPLNAVSELDEEDKQALREFIEFLTTRRRSRRQNQP